MWLDQSGISVRFTLNLKGLLLKGLLLKAIIKGLSIKYLSKAIF